MKYTNSNKSYSTHNTNTSTYNVSERITWFFEELKNWNINPENGMQIV